MARTTSAATEPLSVWDDLMDETELLERVLLGQVTAGTVRNWRSAGSIPYVKIGAKVFYSRRAIQGWLASKAVGA